MYRKLLVLGATGDTGLRLVRQALTAGHHVTCLLRNPSKFQPKHENLKIVQGDLSVQALTSSLAGHDAVMSCLGVHGTSPWNKTTLYTTSMDAIVASMKSVGVKRVVCVTSWYTQLKKDSSNPFWVEYIVKPVICSGFLSDMGNMEVKLAQTDVDYTVVRPGGLSNDKAPGKIKAIEAYSVWPQADLYISRDDVARFMLQTLQTDQWSRKCVAIGVTS